MGINNGCEKKQKQRVKVTVLWFYIKKKDIYVFVLICRNNKKLFALFYEFFYNYNILLINKLILQIFQSVSKQIFLLFVKI